MEFHFKLIHFVLSRVFSVDLVIGSIRGGAGGMRVTTKRQSALQGNSSAIQNMEAKR